MNRRYFLALAARASAAVAAVAAAPKAAVAAAPKAAALFLHDKLPNGWVNVRWFMSDDDVDDSEAFRKAIKMAEETSGGVYVPAGNYNTSPSIREPQSSPPHRGLLD